jgi:hypothetical protein
MGRLFAFLLRCKWNLLRDSRRELANRGLHGGNRSRNSNRAPTILAVVAIFWRQFAT